MIEISGVSFAYPGTKVFENLNLKLPKGKISCVLGPSGCGKSTLLNILSGNIPVQSGEVRNVPEEVSYVFQTPRLVPQKTVFQNLDFVLKSADRDKLSRRNKISEILERVGLSDSCYMYPGNLSGGMAQRVALARAFLMPSDLMLMDEPFKGLDAALKKSVIDVFFSLLERGGDGKTVVFVTHDVDEALLVGDEIFILSAKPSCVAANFSVAQERHGRKLYDPKISEIKNEIHKISESVK